MNKLNVFVVVFLALNSIFVSEALAVKKTELPNGLVIITKTMKTNNIVSFVITLKKVALYETEEYAGL